MMGPVSGPPAAVAPGGGVLAATDTPSEHAGATVKVGRADKT